jgi:hypothetical protein
LATGGERRGFKQQFNYGERMECHDLPGVITLVIQWDDDSGNQSL